MTIYLNEIVMCDLINVRVARGSQKRDLKHAPELCHAIGDIFKISFLFLVILVFWALSYSTQKFDV